MALSGTEAWTLGFVFDSGVLATTTSLTGATWRDGFLRDPDGRLVTSAGPGTYRDGFIRDANGALVVANGASTPPIYSFAAVPATVANLTEPWVFWHRPIGALSEDDALRSIDVALAYGAAGHGHVLDGGDVRLGSDGTLLVMHDSTTGRTCTTDVTVSAQTAATWAALTMKARNIAVPMTDAPPTFSAWLDRIKAIGGVCSPEVKAAGVAQPMADMIVAKGMQAQTLFSVSAVADLAPAKAAGIPTMYFAGQTPDTAANIVAAAPNYVGFDFNASAVTDAMLQTIAAAGIKLLAYTLDSRGDLAAVQARLTGLGLTLSAWASNDAPWVRNVQVPAARTTDPFDAGSFVPGMAIGLPYHQNPIESRGVLVGSAGAYRLQADDPDNPQFIMQGWAVPPRSATSSITVTLTYDAVGTNTARWAAVVFNCPTDMNYFTGSTAQNRGRGYIVLLRPTGSLELFKAPATDGVANTSLATAVPTVAIASGGTAVLKIEPNLAGNIIKVTRVDTGHSIQAVDATYRGDFFHFGKFVNAGEGLKVSFSDVAVVA